MKYSNDPRARVNTRTRFFTIFILLKSRPALPNGLVGFFAKGVKNPAGTFSAVIYDRPQKSTGTPVFFTKRNGAKN